LKDKLFADTELWMRPLWVSSPLIFIEAFFKRMRYALLLMIPVGYGYIWYNWRGNFKSFRNAYLKKISISEILSRKLKPYDGALSNQLLILTRQLNTIKQN
jgi:hypothetical protein